MLFCEGETSRRFCLLELLCGVDGLELCSSKVGLA